MPHTREGDPGMPRKGITPPPERAAERPALKASPRRFKAEDAAKLDSLGFILGLREPQSAGGDLNEHTGTAAITGATKHDRCCDAHHGRGMIEERLSSLKERRVDHGALLTTDLFGHAESDMANERIFIARAAEERFHD
jgi:hypothetical protein